MTRSDPFWNADYSDNSNSEAVKPRLITAYGLGADDAHKGIKDNPYPATSGLFDAYEEGWRDRMELSS